ncbi:MAG: hypothetical protein ACRBEE_09310 [Arenicella sp.]
MNGLKNTLVSTALLGMLLGSSVQAETGITVGGAVGTNGIGGYFSGETGWELGEDKPLQWRLVFGGISVDDVENDLEINDIEYDGDVDMFGAQFGLDWYPFTSSSFFVSSGISYFDREYDLRSDRNDSFTVGGQRVTRADGVRINTNIDHSSAAPYVSVGWGNKRQQKRGFAFFAELGVLAPLDDADVSVTASGNNGIVSQAALNQERQDIQDDLDDLQLLANFGVGYHF